MSASFAVPVSPPAATRSGSRSQALMRAVNQDVRRVLRIDEEDAFPFFCECPDEGCYQPLWLTVGAYDQLARGPTFGISDGHAIPAFSTDSPS